MEGGLWNAIVSAGSEGVQAGEINMIKEDEMILNAFDKLSETFNGDILLYGTGPKTRLILEQRPDARIAGLMDPHKIGETVCNKHVISEEEASRYDGALVIVVARTIHYRVIYKRMYRFCLKHQFKLYGLNGINLFKWFGYRILDSSELAYLKRSKEQFEQMIDRYDVISFDVFDTLIMRKTLYPTDVFYLVEQKAKEQSIYIGDFHNERVYAEQHSRHGNTIYGIYQTLSENIGLNESRCNQLMNLELQTEKETIVVRSEMMEIFNYAIASGKKVFLISDMYLSQELLIELLEAHAIRGYQRILVSCDYDKTKGSGLFEEYKKFVQGESCLHIGDNSYADQEAAKKAGIDSLLIKSAKDLLIMSGLNHLCDHTKTVNERNLVGLMISRLFNSPFALNKNNGNFTISKGEDFGYIFLGAYVVSFMNWMMSKIQKESYDKILFTSRDGYCFYGLYQWFQKNHEKEQLPEAIYIYTSRNLCCQCCDENNEQVRLSYIKYLAQNGVDEHGKYVLFDSYCNGTVQQLLTKFTGYNIRGMYVGKLYGSLDDVLAEGFYEKHNLYTADNDINDIGNLMEAIFTAPEPSVAGIEQGERILFADEDRSEEQISIVSNIHKGIKFFFEEFYSLLYISGSEMNHLLPNIIVNEIRETKLEGECSGIYRMHNKDDIGNVLNDVL